MRRKDPDVVFRILVRVNRAIKRNFGDYTYLREGVWERRVDSGPGYRISFTVENRLVLLLLIGGDKKSQKADIKLAIDYWKDHQS